MRSLKNYSGILQKIKKGIVELDEYKEDIFGELKANGISEEVSEKFKESSFPRKSPFIS